MTQESHGDQWQPPPLKKDDNQPAWQPPPISETEAPSAWQPPPPPPAQGRQKPIPPLKRAAHPPSPLITLRGLRIVLPALFLAGSGIWLATHQADIKCWIQQSQVRINLWLRHPGEAEISNDIAGQLEDLVPGQDEAKLSVSDIKLQHERGKSQGKWSGTAKVWLTVPRYQPLDWNAEAAKVGFDSAAYAKAVETCASLPPNDAPRKPNEEPPLLTKEIQPSGQSVQIPLHGMAIFQGQTWSATVENVAALRPEIETLLKGQTLQVIGKNALPVSSPEAQQALTAFVESRKAFIADVQAAQQRAGQQEDKRQQDKRADDEQAAAGLAQASWHALEKLSGYLLNVPINQRLIDLASQRGDAEKAALYQSYQDTNRRNIDDASASYAEAIRGLSRLPQSVRRKALEAILVDVSAGSSSPWRSILVRRMANDVENLPNFKETTWMDEIRQIREQNK